jgi:beta-lactamase regulating signal transducer with metallopeptidase domain
MIKFALPPMLPLPTGFFSAAPPAPEIGFVGRAAAAGSAALPLVIGLLALHALGSSVVLARIAHGAWQLRRLQRRARRLESGAVYALFRRVAAEHRVASVRLVASGDCDIPISFGILRPTIAIPARFVDELDTSLLRDIFAHELLTCAAATF